jgi:hypothetical protein
MALAIDGMHALGVDKEASDALLTAQLSGRYAPYVWCQVDEMLRERLCGAAEERQTTLIVLRGPLKAGKSRTVLEALRAVGESSGGALDDAMLIEQANAAALARLARGRLRVSSERRCRRAVARRDRAVYHGG